MKKLFALVLIVCMLSVAAFAEVAVGNVCDAAGNVVEAAVATVENMEDRENAVAAELLNKAFDLVKNGAEDVLAAAGLNTDMVITEMYAIAVGNTLAEGSYVELTATADVVLFSADGAAWEVLAEGKLPGAGVVALLKDRGTVITESEEFSAQDVENIATSTVIELPAEAEGIFTRSVAGKAAPSVMVVDGSVAVIKNVNGEIVTNIPVDGKGLVVTPVAEREVAGDLAVRENLDWAYECILAAESVDALVAEDLGDVVVRDLFDVSLYGEFKAAVEAADAVVEVTFADAAAEGLVVLCSHDFATWHTIAAENVTVNANGSVTVALEEVGAIAFAVAADAVAGGVVSPN